MSTRALYENRCIKKRRCYAIEFIYRMQYVALLWEFPISTFKDQMREYSTQLAITNHTNCHKLHNIRNQKRYAESNEGVFLVFTNAILGPNVPYGEVYDYFLIFEYQEWHNIIQIHNNVLWNIVNLTKQCYGYEYCYGPYLEWIQLPNALFQLEHA